LSIIIFVWDKEKIGGANAGDHLRSQMQAKSRV
jgi:hypothetical protein